MFATIPTTTRAAKPPQTIIGYDADTHALTISKGRQRDVYDVAEFPCQIEGRAFRLTKAGGEAYSCLIAPEPPDDICECRGHERYGACKHTDAIRALLANGDLEDPRAAAPDSPHPPADDDYPF